MITYILLIIHTEVHSQIIPTIKQHLSSLLNLGVKEQCVCKRMIL